MLCIKTWPPSNEARKTWARHQKESLYQSTNKAVLSSSFQTAESTYKIRSRSWTSCEASSITTIADYKIHLHLEEWGRPESCEVGYVRVNFQSWQIIRRVWCWVLTTHCTIHSFGIIKARSVLLREIQWTAKRGSSRRRTRERLQVFSLSASSGKIILNPRHELWRKNSSGGWTRCLERGIRKNLRSRTYLRPGKKTNLKYWEANWKSKFSTSSVTTRAYYLFQTLGYRTWESGD